MSAPEPPRFRRRYRRPRGNFSGASGGSTTTAPSGVGASGSFGGFGGSGAQPSQPAQAGLLASQPTQPTQVSLFGGLSTQPAQPPVLVAGDQSSSQPGQTHVMQSGAGETAADGTVSAVVVEDDKVLKKRKVDSEPARSSLHTFSSDVFEVHVGPEPVRFILHETLACRVCPFFERAIQRGFAEATSRMITLADDEPETFSEVVSWIYRDEFFPDIALPEYPKNIQLCKLWVLADKLCMPVLQNRIMEVIAGKTKAQNRAASTETLDYIWSHTLQRSRLRAAFVNICVLTMTRSDLWDRKKILPAEFVQEFCYALVSILNVVQPDRTRYILKLQEYFVETTTPGTLAATAMLKSEAPGKEEPLVSTAASPSAAATSATAGSLA